MPTLVEADPDFVPRLPSRTVPDDHPYGVDPGGDFKHRVERKHRGSVKWKLCRTVPGIGGTGWRTKQGHVLKNHAYYSLPKNINKWNDPVGGDFLKMTEGFFSTLRIEIIRR